MGILLLLGPVLLVLMRMGIMLPGIMPVIVLLLDLLSL